MTIIIKTQPIFNQRTAKVGEFHYDKKGRMVITVASMSDERFCALVALESLAYAILDKSFFYPMTKETMRYIAKRLSNNFAPSLGVNGKLKRKYNKERKGLD